MRRDDSLPEARLDFADALIDVRSAAAIHLLSRIAVTRSLQALWHFREDVFGLIADRHCQAEATSRLAALNRHFRRGGARSVRTPSRWSRADPRGNACPQTPR